MHVLMKLDGLVGRGLLEAAETAQHVVDAHELCIHRPKLGAQPLDRESGRQRHLAGGERQPVACRQFGVAAAVATARASIASTPERRLDMGLFVGCPLHTSFDVFQFSW